MYKTWQDLGFIVLSECPSRQIWPQSAAPATWTIWTGCSGTGRHRTVHSGEIEARLDGEATVKRDVREMLRRPASTRLYRAGDIAAYTRFTGFGGARQSGSPVCRRMCIRHEAAIKAMETMLTDWKRAGVSTHSKKRAPPALHTAKQQPPKNAPRFMGRRSSGRRSRQRRWTD